MSTSFDGFPFPDEFQSPKIKEKPEYGNAYAKAMYYASNRYGARLFYSDAEYQSLVEVAQGRQSVENIRKLFGYFRNQGANPNSEGSESLSYIDIQVVNLAPKYINRAVAKMQAIKFDIGLTVLDALSIDQQKEYEAKIKAFYELKEWMDDVQINPQEIFPDIDFEALPKYPDEMLYNAAVNPKIKKAIDGEIAIKLIHGINNANQMFREVDWDIVTIGRGHVHCYTDGNGVPREERINPKYWLGSYNANENFENLEYSGFIDFLTINQFRKEAEGNLDPEIIEQVVTRFTYENAPSRSGSVYRDNGLFDGLEYIPVMRFYFLSEDRRTFVKRPNKHGNQIILEKGFDYQPDQEVMDRYAEGGDSEIKRVTYTSVYGGTWVIDSDICFNYGRKNYPRMDLVNVTLPIKTFAPNYKEGRTVSFLSQMIEPLYMINVAWNKIKEILAKGWMGVREIDFNQLESVAMGKGGQAWSARDVYEHFLQTNTLIKRGKLNKFDNNEGQAVRDTNSGLLFEDYINMFREGINLLEAMTGTTVAEATEKPSRLAVGVMRASAHAGDLDMEYLYNAHTQLFERTSHQMLLLAQEAKRNKVKIQHFLPALGARAMEAKEVPDNIAYCEYGIMITRQPSESEWADFYQNDLMIALQNGQITASDSAFIRNIDNLKQAREVLAIREQINKREMAQAEAANQQSALDANTQATQGKMQADMAVQQQDHENKKELILLQGKVDEYLLNTEKELEGHIKGVQDSVKVMIAKQQGVDAIMKSAVQNIPKKQQVAERAFRDNQLLDKKHEHAMAEIELQAKVKPKPAAAKKK